MKKIKKIIVFSGKQFSGKDTIAKILLDNFHSFKRIGIADSIKLKYSEQKGISLDEIEKNKSLYRQDLISLGNWGRSQDPDYWLNSIINYDGNTIVTDVRKKHELEILRKNNAFTIRVESNLLSRQQRGTITSANDNTETELDSVSDWDYVIYNNDSYEKLLYNTNFLISAIKNKFGDNL